MVNYLENILIGIMPKISVTITKPDGTIEILEDAIVDWKASKNRCSKCGRWYKGFGVCSNNCEPEYVAYTMPSVRINEI